MKREDGDRDGSVTERGRGGPKECLDLSGVPLWKKRSVENKNELVQKEHIPTRYIKKI
jgi:hypothetical protein